MSPGHFGVRFFPVPTCTILLLEAFASISHIPAPARDSNRPRGSLVGPRCSRRGRLALCRQKRATGMDLHRIELGARESPPRPPFARTSQFPRASRYSSSSRAVALRVRHRLAAARSKPLSYRNSAETPGFSSPPPSLVRPPPSGLLFCLSFAARAGGEPCFF